ncbi:MAG: serine/threonine protein kinase [Gemmatimonadota bacterium]|nr:serine/threonine protein kinase [Gemmatimonadota bacterium]
MTNPRLHPRRSTIADEIRSVGSLGLPADFLTESVRRLQTVALLYAIAFFLAAVFPNILCLVIARFTPQAVCAPYFTTARLVIPPTVSILMGLGAFALIRWGRQSSATTLNLGLAFEVLGSFGIALAEYSGVASGVTYAGAAGVGDIAGFGLSWVSVWVLLFTVVVPSPPRRALLAAVLSVSAVPISFALYVATGVSPIEIDAPEFFFTLIFPYTIVVGMAGVAASVVYQLGTEVRRARELGSYRLVERLGEGGMGEVWRAEHRLLARPAAVKLIRPEVLGANDADRRRINLQRFEREAQATASMRCPHTVELYDFGVADDGTFYYVMELLDGLDLEALVRTHGPVPASRVVYLLRQICHSLAEAHESGLIHRDIKPANIYVCRLGRETDWIKVLDFGMVKRRDDRGDSDPKLTAENVVGGTPAYMSPEQALGDPVDARTDLYSVGCVAYWLLTGHQVFQGRTPMETMMQHVQADPVRPSVRTELPIPPALEDVLMALLAKEPASRPQTADALATRLADGLPEVAWTAQQAAMWWDRHYPRPAR